MTNHGAGRRNWLYAGLAVFVLANLGVLLWRSRAHSIPRGAKQEQLDEQARRVNSWLASRAISFQDKTAWVEAIKQMPYGGCVEVPDQAQEISKETIERDGVALPRLLDAVVDLLTVYSENSPELLVEYMRDHGEQPASQSIDALRQIVANLRSVPISSVSDLSAEEVVAAVWKENDLNSRWSAVLDGGSCYSFWRYQAVPGEDIEESFGATDGLVFENLCKSVHQFEPVRPISDALRSDGSVLFADVKILIQFSPDYYSKPAPYYFRFWYDSRDQVWHPHRMAHVRIEKAGEGPTHLF
jgi:hypothetical protein